MIGRSFVFVLALLFALAVPIIGWIIFAIVCNSLSNSLRREIVEEERQFYYNSLHHPHR